MIFLTRTRNPFVRSVSNCIAKILTFSCSMQIQTYIVSFVMFQSGLWIKNTFSVHYWLIRHLYFPLIRLRISKKMSTFIVFLVSAVVHELLVSVPFHMVRPWSFIGMMMQMPLVAITKYLYRKYPGSSVGNIIFWLSFCVVGQPMAVLLYTVDYRYAQLHQGSTSFFRDTMKLVDNEQEL